MAQEFIYIDESTLKGCDSPMDDNEIIDLYWSRDQAAIEETDKKYGSNCHRIANDILSSLEDSEECVDDTYMAAWNSIPPQRPLHLSAYLYRIVRNFCFIRLRELHAQKRGGGKLDLILDELEECVEAPSSVEKEYEAKELTEEIEKFLHSLSKDDRRIFVHRYWLTLPSKDIASRLGFKESKVNTSLHRSRIKLREHLLKEGMI